MNTSENTIDPEFPFISIIIPTLNVQRYIERCLISLQELQYPKDKYEILVVDNGSSDGTLAIVRRYDVKLLEEDGTISRLRNVGAKKAEGSILAFIDADCVAPRMWLTDAIQFLKGENIGAAGSWYQLPQETTFVERVWDIQTSSRRERTGDIDWIPSGNLIITKDVFNSIGGFDENLRTSEDVDLCQRIQKKGLKIFTHPSLGVEHFGNPKTIKEFFIKEKWRGEGVLQNLIRENAVSRWNKAILYTIVIFLLFISAFFGGILWLLSGSYGVFAGSFFGLILIPLLMSGKTVMRNHKWIYFPALAFLFFIYGLSRSLSFLNFAFKRKSFS